MKKPENHPLKGMGIERDFVRNLEKLRGDMSLREFAARCGMSYSGMRKYFAGESSPTLAMLAQIAHACNTTPIQLIMAEGVTALKKDQINPYSPVFVAINALSREELDQLNAKVIRYGGASLLEMPSKEFSSIPPGALHDAKLLAELPEDRRREIREELRLNFKKS